jgi:hypothetical protein
MGMCHTLDLNRYTEKSNKCRKTMDLSGRYTRSRKTAKFAQIACSIIKITFILQRIISEFWMDRVFPLRVEYYSASVLESLHLDKLSCVRPNLRLRGRKFTRGAASSRDRQSKRLCTFVA